MKIIRSKNEIYWITGNLPFRFFTFENNGGALTLGPKMYSDFKDMIDMGRIIICVKNDMDRVVLSDIFKDHGFKVTEVKQVHGRESWFDPLEMHDIKDYYLPPLLPWECKSFNVVLKEDKEISRFLDFLSVLSKEYSYKTQYIVENEDHTLITSVIK